MKAIQPYLNFAGRTEEAFRFYHSVLGGELLGPLRFRDMGSEQIDQMGLTGDDVDKVMHVGLKLPSGALLMGTDSLECLGQTLNQGNNVHLNLDTESREEAQGYYSALSEGGSVEMELQRTPWAELYAAFTDRFGTRWMVNYDGDAVFEMPSAG